MSASASWNWVEAIEKNSPRSKRKNEEWIASSNVKFAAFLNKFGTFYEELPVVAERTLMNTPWALGYLRDEAAQVKLLVEQLRRVMSEIESRRQRLPTPYGRHNGRMPKVDLYGFSYEIDKVLKEYIRENGKVAYQ
jgi:hypothetical protein